MYPDFLIDWIFCYKFLFENLNIQIYKTKKSGYTFKVDTFYVSPNNFEINPEIMSQIINIAMPFFFVLKYIVSAPIIFIYICCALLTIFMVNTNDIIQMIINIASFTTFPPFLIIFT